MHNQVPPPKKPEEEMLTLKTTKQIINASDKMKHILEVEFRLPRNYIPLPKPDESNPDDESDAVPSDPLKSS